MHSLAFKSHPDLLVGLEAADDAGVFRITPEIALIQTVDFFTPIVNDPYQFGQIAAANALSDVYAMGGRPLTAMNIACFPLQTTPTEVLKEILRGGLDKVHEAGALLVGGHSVEDPELKYGLAVTGIVHPDRLLTKGGAQKGVLLVLTKPLGTGIIATALKGRLASQDAEAASLMGVNSERIRTITMGMGAGVVAAAGTLLLPIYYLFPDIGGPFTRKAFVITILGGWGPRWVRSWGG